MDPSAAYRWAFYPEEVRERPGFRQFPHSGTSRSRGYAVCPVSLQEGLSESVFPRSPLDCPSGDRWSEGFGTDVFRGQFLEQDDKGKGLRWW